VNILLEQVRQSFAKALNVRSDEIEFLGEPDLGFQLGIAGLLNAESRLFYSKEKPVKSFCDIYRLFLFQANCFTTFIICSLSTLFFCHSSKRLFMTLNQIGGTSDIKIIIV